MDAVDTPLNDNKPVNAVLSFGETTCLRKPIRKCRCGQHLKQQWHLLCGSCWNRLSPALQAELIEAYNEGFGSQRHAQAVMICLLHLGPATHGKEAK